jgi:uncharacterized protein YndB with AHSA1/START domain
MSDPGTVTACYSLSFTRLSRHPAERLWRAITDPDEITRWTDYPARVDLRPGGAWNIDFGRTDEGDLAGVVVRVVTGRELAYVWGRSVIEWMITPRAGGCEYRFVHHGIERRGIDGEEGLAAGWHGFLDQLDAYLDGTPLDRRQQRLGWTALRQSYRDALCSVFTVAAPRS